ncbi:MAG: 50S ribosomal protein L11 methyltransferase [Alphaproteobacteria bacterium]|nr:50S ribosomal protein L11 methyltransferase [Alphaproteobacteria bacterium]
MFWRIFFHAQPSHAADLGSSLEDHVSAVSWFETKDADLWIIEAIMTKEPQPQDFLSLLSPICQKLHISLPSLSIEKIPDTDWLEATWRSFPPQQIGRYYVYGSHTTPKPPQDSVTLEINAATAFGSGEHETTTGCLLTLDDLATEGRTFQKPLDMGCGSGILAIAMAKTWNVNVLAADNDPECIRVATHNAALNHCAPLFQGLLSEGFENPNVYSRAPYDLITANILAAPLISMAKELSQSLAPKGLVILSGLLNRDREEVVNAYRTYGLRLHSLRTLNDWVALLLEKTE